MYIHNAKNGNICINSEYVILREIFDAQHAPSPCAIRATKGTV